MCGNWWAHWGEELASYSEASTVEGELFEIHRWLVEMTVAVERGGGATPQHLTRIKSTGEEKIYVTVRVRPLSAKEIARSDVSDWECTNNHTIAFKHALPERSPFPATYTFGKVTFSQVETSPYLAMS